MHSLERVNVYLKSDKNAYCEINCNTFWSGKHKKKMLCSSSCSGSYCFLQVSKLKLFWCTLIIHFVSTSKIQLSIIDSPEQNIGVLQGVAGVCNHCFIRNLKTKKRQHCSKLQQFSALSRPFFEVKKDHLNRTDKSEHSSLSFKKKWLSQAKHCTELTI